jgi:uncharacterized Fe-S radical SAM superfamily protein PflX
MSFLFKDIRKSSIPIRRSMIDIMDRYHPCGRARDFPPLDRHLSTYDYRQALEIAGVAGITRLDKREIPDLLQRLYRIHGR